VKLTFFRYVLGALAAAALSAVVLPADAETTAVRLPGSAARAKLPSHVSCFSTDLARITNTCSGNRTFTVAMPVVNAPGIGLQQNKNMGTAVFANSGATSASSCRSVALRSDSTFMWTQGWKPLGHGWITLAGPVGQEQFVEARGSLIVECDMASLQSVSLVMAWDL
jgi:hypothetical protein